MEVGPGQRSRSGAALQNEFAQVLARFEEAVGEVYRCQPAGAALKRSLRPQAASVFAALSEL